MASRDGRCSGCVGNGFEKIGRDGTATAWLGGVTQIELDGNKLRDLEQSAHVEIMLTRGGLDRMVAGSGALETAFATTTKEAKLESPDWDKMIGFTSPNRSCETKQTLGGFCQQVAF